MTFLESQYDPILDELKRYEPIFHHPEIFGESKENIQNMMCSEFWEVGASGNAYTQEVIVEELLKRYKDPLYEDVWETKEFKCTKIAPNNYLLTYILIQNNTRVTRRATIWRNTSDGWKILYHQGTVVDK